MKTVFHLSSCSTCKRILKELEAEKHGFVLQDIKTVAISNEQIERMRELAGSYAALFSRRSRQYAARGLKGQNLSEQDYKALILEEYTFLKRPVILGESHIAIGNSDQAVATAKDIMTQQ